MNCIILNLDYQPLSIVSWKRAIILMSKGKKVTVLDYHETTVKSEKESHKIPSLMVYNKYISIKKQSTPTKRKILVRDDKTCQYCSSHLGANATVDHIIPVSRFKNRIDSNTWDNLVACCKECNAKKGNKTPDEAGMKLLKKPKPFSNEWIYGKYDRKELESRLAKAFSSNNSD